MELCLTSNVITKSVASYDEHHFKELWAQGHPVALCTDDAGVFSTTLTQELQHAARAFALSSALHVITVCKLYEFCIQSMLLTKHAHIPCVFLYVLSVWSPRHTPYVLSKLWPMCALALLQAASSANETLCASFAAVQQSRLNGYCIVHSCTFVHHWQAVVLPSMEVCSWLVHLMLFCRCKSATHLQDVSSSSFPRF